MARYYSASIYDYYHGRMSLWQLAVRIRHLPVESACNAARGSDGISMTEYLLFDLFSVTAGEPHPGDPRVQRKKAEEQRQLNAGKVRSDDRRARHGIRGSVLRKHTAREVE